MIEDTLKAIYFQLGGGWHHKSGWSGAICPTRCVLSLSMTVFTRHTLQSVAQSGDIRSINHLTTHTFTL